MKSGNHLAIVIPAYKKNFLEESIRSIAGQTCKDFTLYIGDDASPYDLYPLIKPFEEQIEIVYRRFDKNLGSKNLVAHWERCIDMIREEEWIWLFSDDDVMENRCVELFYSAMESGKSDLYHFNVIVIDKHSEIKRRCTEYPPHLTARAFFEQTIEHTLESYVTEYIFNKQHFLDCNRFQYFDLAWGSDHATWTKLAFDRGIVTVPGSKVRWRSSEENISSVVRSPKVIARQLQAGVSFYLWGKGFFREKGIGLGIDDRAMLKSFLDRNAHFFPFLSPRLIKKRLKEFAENNQSLFKEGYRQAIWIRKAIKKANRKQLIRKIRARKRQLFQLIGLRFPFIRPKL